MKTQPEFWAVPILQPGLGRPWVAQGGFIPVVLDKHNLLRLTDDPIGRERAIEAMFTLMHHTVEAQYPGQSKGFDLAHVLNGPDTKYLHYFHNRMGRDELSPTPGSADKAAQLDAQTRLVWNAMADEMMRNSLPWRTYKGLHRPISLGVIDHQTYEELRDSVADPSRYMMDFLGSMFKGKPADQPTLLQFNTRAHELMKLTGSTQEDWLGDKRAMALLKCAVFPDESGKTLDAQDIESRLGQWMESRRVLRAMHSQDMAFSPLSDNDLGMLSSDEAPESDARRAPYQSSVPRGELTPG